MTTFPAKKSAEDLLFSHYLRTGERLNGEAAQAFLETKVLDDAKVRQRKSAEAVLFTHYLRTGERLSGDRASRFLELKFNQRHLRENGQFARAGEGIFFGGGTAANGTTASSHHSRASAEKPRPSEAFARRRISDSRQNPASSRGNAVLRPTASRQNEPNPRTSVPLHSGTERSTADQTLENFRRTFGTVSAEKLNISLVPQRQHFDLTPGDSATSFALRQVGAGTYEQLQANPHAVGEYAHLHRGRMSLRCNAMVYDALNWSGAAPSRMQGGRIPVANEWGNSRVAIGYYPVVTKFKVPKLGFNTHIASQLREGDVISDGKHVALVTLRFGSPQSVSAVPMWWIDRSLNSDLPVRGGVVRNDWGFRPGQVIVVRRFDRANRTR